MVNHCKHQDKARVNNTLKQCVSCGKLFTTKPPREAMGSEDSANEAPSGYKSSGFLCDKYGVHYSTVARWAKKGLVSKYGRHWYYEKDVKSCVDHLGEYSSELRRTGLVSTRLTHRVHHLGLSGNDQRNY